jgi:hypothetical protein
LPQGLRWAWLGWGEIARWSRALRDGVCMACAPARGQVGLPVIGVVENMSGFVCPNCHNESQIFPATHGAGAEAMAHQMGVPFLGRIPIDPRIGTENCRDYCELGCGMASIGPDRVCLWQPNAAIKGPPSTRSARIPLPQRPICM